MTTSVTSPPAHESSDFDGVLVGYTSASADGLHVDQADDDLMKFVSVHQCLVKG